MRKVLIANRGEIAIRVIRACQELGLRSVAVHSTADRDSLHAKLADESICIGPAPSTDSYLSIPKIMSAVELAGVDAVHPGYGFLAESAEFARVCDRYGITFIGPTAQQMATLGNKVKARELAKKCKVPLLPGSVGTLTSAICAERIAKEIGFPVIVKAANGGGGRGMKIAHSREELRHVFPMAQREALVSFGSSDCYLERYLKGPRHIEVQLIADQHGNMHALGERDCSLQRRHQKIIEEAPSPALSASEREQVCNYALKLAKASGYQSLGTVEFLYEAGQFYFMEVNTRVQVEHPVTEEIAKIDLVKEQIKIADSHQLNLDKGPFKAQGHALECRINAEDPDTFAPWPGLVTEFYQPGGPGVRVDSMLFSGYRVPSHYDSMVAKIITVGSDRSECVARMRRALKETKIDGIRTNLAFHLRILEDQDFVAGNFSTHFVGQFIAKRSCETARPLDRSSFA